LGLGVLNAPDIEGAALPGQKEQTLVKRALSTVKIAAQETMRRPNVETIRNDPEMILKRVWAALATAQVHYRPQKKFAGKLVLFKAEVGPNWAATVFDDPLLGWKEYVTGGI